MYVTRPQNSHAVSIYACRMQQNEIFLNSAKKYVLLLRNNQVFNIPLKQFFYYVGFTDLTNLIDKISL